MKRERAGSEALNCIPKIDPVPNHLPRPDWSVMIPTCDRVEYLSETLASVLAQDFGPEQMQIEVVDSSSNDEVEKLVREVGRGRIASHRVNERMSLAEAMTLCIQRARGRFVHILHDDDLVLPGFYSKLQKVLVREPVGAAFCRYAYIDEQGRKSRTSDKERDDVGVLDGWLERIAEWQRIQVVAMAVKRDVFEQVGGFCTALSYATDWDMWKRIASRFAFGYEPDVLALYRVHSSSDSQRVIRSGRNVADLRKSIEIAEAYLPAEKTHALSRLARHRCARFALATAWCLLREKQDLAAASKQILQALQTDPGLFIKALWRYVWARPK